MFKKEKINKFLYIFVFQAGRVFYKHLERCLQEITIVPQGCNCEPIRSNFLFFVFSFLKFHHMWDSEIHLLSTQNCTRSQVTGSESVFGSFSSFFF